MERAFYKLFPVFISHGYLNRCKREHLYCVHCHDSDSWRPSCVGYCALSMQALQCHLFVLSGKLRASPSSMKVFIYRIESCSYEREVCIVGCSLVLAHYSWYVLARDTVPLTFSHSFVYNFHLDSKCSCCVDAYEVCSMSCFVCVVISRKVAYDSVRMRNHHVCS